MAVDTYEEGFLLSEVVMGEGILDLKPMVQTLRQAVILSNLAMDQERRVYFNEIEKMR
jgi:hypothetical protein